MASAARLPHWPLVPTVGMNSLDWSCLVPFLLCELRFSNTCRTFVLLRSIVAIRGKHMGPQRDCAVSPQVDCAGGLQVEVEQRCWRSRATVVTVNHYILYLDTHAVLASCADYGNEFS